MKKNRFFAVTLLMLSSLSLGACNFMPSGLFPQSNPASQNSESESAQSESSVTEEVKLPEAHKIYELYLAQGGTLSYEEWLASVKGEKGEPGHTPVVTIGANGNWLIDGNDTNIKAQGEKGEPGEKGEDGKTAYELYCETHPGYTKSEQDWLDDLLNGRLAEQVTHTVSFKTNGGSEVSNQTIAHGEKISKPADPTKPGYTFKGWQYQGETWSFLGYVVTSDMTLEAVWEAIDYTVTFKNEDGTVLETQEGVHYGDQITYNGETPTKPNPLDHYCYTFKSWNQELTVTGDMVFVAQYNETFAPFTVLYQNDDGTELYHTYVVEKGFILPDMVTWDEAKQKDSYYSIPFGMTMDKWSTQTNYDWQYEHNSADEVVTLAIGARIGSSGDYNLFEGDRQKLNITINGEDVPIANVLTYQASGLSTDETNYMPLCSFILRNGINTISIRFTTDSGYRLYIGDQVRLYRSNVYLDVDKSNGAAYQGEIPTKENSNGLQYEFDKWERISDENDIITYQATYKSAPEGMVFENEVVNSYTGNAEEVTIPEVWNGQTITKIARQAFSHAATVKKINIPNTITFIQEKAFEYSGIESITIPESVNIIEGSLFLGCTALAEVTYNTSAYPSSAVLFKLNCLKKVTFNCRKVPNDACKSCVNLEEIILGDNVEELGSYCFSGCTGVTSIIIPPKLTHCGFYSFQNTGLKSIILPEGITSVSNSFRDTKLDYVVIPISLKKIEGQAFYCGNDAMIVYYMGNEAEWEQVTVDELNTYMLNNVYFYRENEPTEAGNYWHYVDGVPTIW